MGIIVVWRPAHRPGRRVVRRGGRGCLGEFRWLVAPSSTLSSPDPLFSGLPQSSPSSSTPYGFPYCESLLQRWVGSTVGAAILIFSLLPTSDIVCQSIVSLTDPPSTRTPRSCISGSSLVRLNRNLNENSKDIHRR